MEAGPETVHNSVTLLYLSGSVAVKGGKDTSAVMRGSFAARRRGNMECRRAVRWSWCVEWMWSEERRGANTVSAVSFTLLG